MISICLTCDKDFFGYQEKSFTPNLSDNKNVKGRLKSHIHYWHEIGANEDIINIICDGYKLPFFEVPKPLLSKNNRSAIDNLDFVESAVNDLLCKRCIVETHFVPHIVSPLIVSINKQGKGVLF